MSETLASNTTAFGADCWKPASTLPADVTSTDTPCAPGGAMRSASHTSKQGTAFRPRCWPTKPLAPMINNRGLGGFTPGYLAHSGKAVIASCPYVRLPGSRRARASEMQAQTELHTPLVY